MDYIVHVLEIVYSMDIFYLYAKKDGTHVLSNSKRDAVGNGDSALPCYTSS